VDGFVSPSLPAPSKRNKLRSLLLKLFNDSTLFVDLFSVIFEE